MSEKKLTNYLRIADISPPVGHLRRLPVVLTDSKGYSLENNIVVDFDRNIRWWNHSGSKIEECYSWLKRELPTKIYELGDIALYIWLGTCDLTTKDPNTGYISLTSEDQSTTDHVIKYLEKFKTFIAEFPQVRLTFLEIPVYSIKAYNEHKGHLDPLSLKNQDNSLASQVNLVNQTIRNLNDDLEANSPDFSKFLKARKQEHKKNKKKRKTVEYYNFNLYRDGIHPGQLLARAWLREIAHRVKDTCWE